MKIKFCIFGLAILLILLICFYCEDDTNPANSNQTSQPTPVDPEIAIVGSWNCPVLNIDDQGESELLLTYNNDNTYEKREYLDYSGDYTVEQGNYTIEDNRICRNRLLIGSSSISYEDALDNLYSTDHNFTYYFYVDD